MALNYIVADAVKSAELLNLLSRMSSDLAQLGVVYEAMKFKIDGDGSSATQFDVLTASGGYGSNADAKRSFDEVGATLGGSDALIQCAAYHRK